MYKVKEGGFEAGRHQPTTLAFALKKEISTYRKWEARKEGKRREGGKEIAFMLLK